VESNREGWFCTRSIELPRLVEIVEAWFQLDPTHERGQLLKEVRYLVKLKIEAADVHLTSGIAVSSAHPMDRYSENDLGVDLSRELVAVSDRRAADSG
jgi:hypothetical protein